MLYYGIKQNGDFFTIKSRRAIQKEELNDKSVRVIIPISFIDYMKLYFKTNDHREV